ncbi:cytochrome P450 [Microvirga lupini]|uniref:Cytochrome P450 n=1 Tax=Microvirga lupini TaxID=420324 RepID=A0A7W4VN14_9HYPH|nr:cytochrome P450 [Microvirga lupini]MBB3019755.1 cytochrome P450 [Microvirga lupini]
MSIDALPMLSEQSPGIAVSRRSPLSVLPALVRDPLQALPPEVYREPLVYSRVANRQRVFLLKPAFIQETLVRNADALSKGEDVRRALGPALGQGLLTADGAHWRWQRQSVVPAFRHEKLVGLLPAMISAAERTRDRWLAAGSGAPIRIAHEMMRTTFDIIVETMMSGPGGIDVVRVERGITDYLKPTGWIFALSILNAPDWVPYPGRGRARAAMRYLRSAITGMISERRRSGEARDDLVALLLAAADHETGRMMTDEEIADNLLTFITAGHETTALGLAWTLLLLAHHPEHEARVLSEIDAVTAGGPVRSEHISELIYTRQVFSEAMRLYPPAPIITRTATRAFPLDRFMVPERAVIVVPIHAVHHHAAIWEQPERFDPERFAPEQARARHRYAYMPFGAGPRICIGSAFAQMEAIAILAVLLKAVRLLPKSSTMPAPVMKVTLRPTADAEMLVETRS